MLASGLAMSGFSSTPSYNTLNDEATEKVHHAAWAANFFTQNAAEPICQSKFMHPADATEGRPQWGWRSSPVSNGFLTTRLKTPKGPADTKDLTLRDALRIHL